MSQWLVYRPRIANELGMGEDGIVAPSKEIMSFKRSEHECIRNAFVLDAIYLAHGSPTIYVKDIDLVGMLLDAKFDADDESLFVRDLFVFSLAVPFIGNKGKGLRVAPMAVFTGTKAPQQVDISPYTANGFPFVGSNEKENGKKGVIFFTSGEAYGLHGLSVTVPFGSAATLLDLRNLDALPGEAEAYPERPAANELHSRSARFLFAVMIYLQAYPDRLVEGYPTDSKKKEVAYHLKPKPFSVSFPEAKHFTRRTAAQTGPRATHFRRMHFRTLRDERYKRNPDGSPKVIAVSASVVSGKETYTALNTEGFKVTKLKVHA